MRKIHSRLLKKSRSYASWHGHPHREKVHWGAFILVAIIIGFFILQSIEDWKNNIYNFITVDLRMPNATLALDPQTKSVKVGDTFPVNIILDTDGKGADGVDLYSLHYDPTIVSVVDDNTSKSGIQITPGGIMEFNALNSVDEKTGTIKFSQASEVGTYYNGKGVLAVIHFKAKAPGSTYLKFDFVPGNTKDTNVANRGEDQLVNVVDGLYTVSDR